MVPPLNTINIEFFVLVREGFLFFSLIFTHLPPQYVSRGQLLRFARGSFERESV